MLLRSMILRGEKALKENMFPKAPKAPAKGAPSPEPWQPKAKLGRSDPRKAHRQSPSGTVSGNFSCCNLQGVLAEKTSSHSTSGTSLSLPSRSRMKQSTSARAQQWLAAKNAGWIK